MFKHPLIAIAHKSIMRICTELCIDCADVPKRMCERCKRLVLNKMKEMQEENI